MKIKNKKTVHYTGNVIDLQVEGSHTYNVEGLGVHNSGGGSLINYVLQITELDPIRWGLPFSRFMSVYRVGLPDIDTDFSDRDKVLEELRAFFGFTNVIPISNYNVLKVKSLVRDLSKFYSIPLEEVNAALKTVEQDVRSATLKEGDDKNLFVLTFDEAMIYSKPFATFMEQHPEVASSMKVLFKENRSLSRHAGGVLICDHLADEMPLIVSGGEPQTPWVEGVATKQLEKIGNFIKFDLLGLETLRLFEETIKYILQRRASIQFDTGEWAFPVSDDAIEKLNVGDSYDNKKITFIQHKCTNVSFEDIKNWYIKHLHIDNIDITDQHVYEYVYHEGRFEAIFQCVSAETLVTMSDGSHKKIIDISPGEFVMSHNNSSFESHEVINVFDKGEKECIELLFDNGKKLICTPDHKILTNRGWIEAQNLTENDEIMEYDLWERNIFVQFVVNLVQVKHYVDIIEIKYHVI